MGIPLIVGEGPNSRATERYPPLSGRPGMVLAKMLGLDPDPDGSTWGRWYWPLRERFDTVNLFDRHQRSWSAPRAREAAGIVPLAAVNVLLGRRVAAAFSVGHVGYHERFRIAPEGLGADDITPSDEAYEAVVIPHPSGLNRLLNDPAERERCGESLRWALGQAG